MVAEVVSNPGPLPFVPGGTLLPGQSFDMHVGGSTVTGSSPKTPPRRLQGLQS